MTPQDAARAYLALCEEYNWLPSVKGLDAWFRLQEGGFIALWRS